MKIWVDSVEYKCWHEVGHATVCLHLGGDVYLIEFLDSHGRGYARTNCFVMREIERSVACGGFAAEFYLLNQGYAALAEGDSRDISQVVFHNATADREDFWGRKPVSEDSFSEAEDREFMRHAVDVVAPIIARYFEEMQAVVLELRDAKRVDGRRIAELLRLAKSE